MKLSTVAAGTVAAAVAVGFARAAFLVIRVDGNSMAPTFRPGESVLAIRRFFRPRVRRDDIVVCRLPAQVPGPDALLIKRVISVRGDTGLVFVQGDGPGSYDSRQFGPIPVANVVGHVIARLSLSQARLVD